MPLDSLTEDQVRVAEEERERLCSQARDRSAARAVGATSINQSDAALVNLRFELKRIEALSHEQLLEKAAQRNATIERQSEQGSVTDSGAQSGRSERDRG